MVPIRDMSVEALVKTLVQETVGRVLSGIADQLRENASRDDIMMKLKITLLDLSRNIEQTRDLTITNPDDRDELKALKHKYNDWRERVEMHMQQLEDGQEVWASCSLLLALFSNKYMTSDHVQYVEWYAKRAKDLVDRVSTISNNPHSTSLVGKLLAGESIRYESRQGSETHWGCIHPFRLQERGVEAALQYKYFDHKRPGKSFTIRLFLRLRESTDIVGVAKRCLKRLPSQLNLVHESALHQLAKLLADSPSGTTTWRAPALEESYSRATKVARPDTFCCKAKAQGPCANTDSTEVISPDSEVSDILPEEVIWFDFTCFAGAAVNYIFGASSSDKLPIASRDNPEGTLLPLEVNLSFLPHGKFEVGRANRGAVELEGIGRKQVQDVGSLQEFLGIVESNAGECFLHDPQWTKCTATWNGNHGGSRIVVDKSTTTMLQVLHSFEILKEQWAHDPVNHAKVVEKVLTMMKADYSKSFVEQELLMQVLFEMVEEQWGHDPYIRMLATTMMQDPENFAKYIMIMLVLVLFRVNQAALEDLR